MRIDEIILDEELYNPSDIKRIVETAFDKNTVWTKHDSLDALFEHFDNIVEAKNKNKNKQPNKPLANPAQPLSEPPKIQTFTCALFEETLKKHEDYLPKLKEFLSKLNQDPLLPVEPLRGVGPIGQLKPAMIHAKLGHDMRLFYIMAGRNPHNVYLYGLFSHDESGTGQPPNANRQNSLIKRFKNQEFVPKQF
jgi:hypothetical protein